MLLGEGGRKGRTGVTNIYEHTVYTTTIHHLKTPEVHKYSKSYKMYFQYSICMRLNKHEITSLHSGKYFLNSLQAETPQL